MVKYIFIAIAAIIIGVIIWLALQKGEINVKRSIVINKPLVEVWNPTVDLNNWSKWSPWLCIEPDSKIAFNGISNNTNGKLSWEGEIAGKGEIENTQINLNQSILQELRFEKPYKSKLSSTINFKDSSNSTIITWSTSQKLPFLMRFMSKQLKALSTNNMDRGLNMLKEFITNGKVSSKIEINGIVNIPEYKYIGIRKRCKMEEVASSMQAVMQNLSDYATQNNLTIEKVFSIYHHFNFDKGDCDYTSALVVKENHILNSSKMIKGKIPATKAIKITFIGNYNNLPNGWMAIYAYQNTKKLTVNGELFPFENYVTDPKKETDPDKWITEIYLPIK